MVDVSGITAAFQSLKVAGDILQSMVGLKVATEVQGQVWELQRVIMSAQGEVLLSQSAQATLVEQIGTLEKEIARLKAWDGEKERYQLTAPGTGAVTYALKEEARISEPPHWLCVKCYGDHRKSYLQRQDRVQGLGGRNAEWSCSTCGAKIYVDGMVVPTFAPPST